MTNNTANAIREGKTSLGIEFGSTRIKAVLIDDTHTVIAQGSHTWENQFENGIWTYDLREAVSGLQDCYADLCRDIKEKYDTVPEKFGCIGVSGMMHGFIPLDKNGTLLTPFRTWRNIITEQASDMLTEMFGCNIPQRWSVAHLAQAILNEEPYVRDIARMTTLAGYIHLLLTGVHGLGCNEASGMFPVDPETLDFDAKMEQSFNAFLGEHGMPYKMGEIFPHAIPVGGEAGSLTAEGAKILDPAGNLKPGTPFCPPEGDGGTGMVCTGSVSAGTGSVSVGTSAFALFVLDKPLIRPERQIEAELSPGGAPLVQIHGNNGASEIDGWIGVFAELLGMNGEDTTPGSLYEPLFKKAMTGDPDCGGFTAYNNLAGEHLTGIASGAPMTFRTPDAKFTLANFMRAQLSAVFAPLACGYELLRREGVKPERVLAHGGLFRTKGTMQVLLSAALDTPVSVRETAGEGGPFGMALLAAYKKNHEKDETLESYLENRVFAGQKIETAMADEQDREGYAKFLERYRNALDAARAAAASVQN